MFICSISYYNTSAADNGRDENRMRTMLDKNEYLQQIDKTIAEGKYKDNWNSLSAFEVPEWYKNAKFGIFIHWGLYSIPAYDSEWYSRNMYIEGSKAYEHHLAVYGHPKAFGYKDFIPMFRAEKFDADEWATLFKQAGARYVMPVAEHHDGFQMYKSSISHYNTYEMGPKRDLLGEMKVAYEKQGLTLCVSSHRAEHWFFMSHGKNLIQMLRSRSNAVISTGLPCQNQIIRTYTAHLQRMNIWKIG